MNYMVNPLNAKLNPICHLLALLGAHPVLHISKIRVKNLCIPENAVNSLTILEPISFTIRSLFH
jgi:hypothetical protein